MKHSLPVGPDDLTPDLLTELVSETYPGVRVETVRIVEAKGYGEVNVSTSARVKLQLEYAAGAPSTLPKHVVVKMSLDVDAWPGRLYTFFENEVNFYQRIRPELEIETPVALGGRFDPDTKRYCLILEDVGSRGAHFSSQNDEASIENTRSILETYAKLHATFWESPRFEDDLSFVQTHMKGGVEELMHGIVRDGIKDELSRQIVKRELVGADRRNGGGNVHRCLCAQASPGYIAADSAPWRRTFWQYLSAARWHWRPIRLATFSKRVPDT